MTLDDSVLCEANGIKFISYDKCRCTELRKERDFIACPYCSKAAAQTRMNELNWQRDRIQEEIREADQRLKRVIEEGRGLLAEHPTLSLKTPRPVELPRGCMSPAKSRQLKQR